MKRKVLKQLRAVRRMVETSNIELKGRLSIELNGTIDEWDKLLIDLKNDGWQIYRHYVEIGNVSIALLLN